MSTPLRIGAISAIIAGSFLAGTWYSRRPAHSAAAQSRGPILYYRDPMHPAYRSDKPGIAPDCGMELEPVYAEAEAAEKPALPAGAVEIRPDKQQLIGMRTEPAVKKAGAHTVRATGQVALDETRLQRVAAAVDGWIRSTAPVTTGSIVGKDQLLGTFYNRDFLTAQQTYLYALNTLDRFEDKESAEQLKLTRAQMQAAEENLEFLGMSRTQMRKIAQDRQIARDIELRSPVPGLVVGRNALPGLRFDRGAELYRIADLSHVWVLADLFGREARYAVPGGHARILIPGDGRTLDAHFSDALPQFAGASRTMRTRLEVDNPGFLLRPDMFVDVEFTVALPAAISVPADAVIDSGRATVAFVDRGNGYFEPRKVETGWRLDGRVEITRGIQAGEQVVVSGSFLLDSESRMRVAALPARAKDPVCGMEVDPARAAGSSRVGADMLYFCSSRCKAKFDADPGAYRNRQNPE